jgi:endonuclease/exonuclease/phosphatase family metal-dependent hydrolase
MAATTLRFASFNIRYGRAPDGWHSWWLRRRATAATLTQLSADVVGLQEATEPQLRYLLDRLEPYRSVGGGRRRDGGGEHCAVLFRSSRFAWLADRTRWFGDDPDRPGTKLPRASHPRIATIVRLAPVDPTTERALPVEVEVVNTHLDERHDDNRRRSIEQLVTWLDDDVPRVVLGDFNAPPGPVLDPLLDAGYRLAHGEAAGPTFHRFGHTLDGPQIDHLLVSPHWDIIDARIERDTRGWHLPSDHWPVVADLSLPI